LHSSGVSPWNIEFAAAIETDPADSSLAFGNRATVAAGETTDAIVIEILDERRFGFADLYLEDVAKSGHNPPLLTF
jgi:hypothetical protein